ncbi:DNA ligase 4 [Hondaea fermentalgiana]|uniref:DNA ligase (ATP) n=1 Tax=Hondaea fermentalgiana TaxID=2315210 RepID=A0A2R5GXN0_9STRA|nr:DNA ligase 4 [Hondaea fermentalgiana]|eukprot:GBG34548.1 DNA ligase 4 [Hondaea fermentalgiana]
MASATSSAEQSSFGRGSGSGEEDAAVSAYNPPGGTSSKNSSGSAVYVEGPSDHADNVKFYTLCVALERAEKATLKPRQRVRLFFNRRLVDTSTKQTMYPLVRLIVPQVDNARKRYGIRETLLKGLVRESIGLSKTSALGLKINHYKDERYAGPHSGRLPGVVEDVLRERGNGPGDAGNKLTVKEANQELDKLARAADNDERRLILRGLLNKMNSVEFKWILNIVIGDKMNIKIKHESFLRALHDDALDQYNSHLNLRRVCAQCRDPSVRLRAEVTLFKPFKPMLGYKPSSNMTCLDGFGGEPFAVEPKLDGERLLVHWARRDPGAVKVFSRQGLDMGKMYRYNEALQAQLEHALLADECIVDGELVLYDQTTGKYAAFGANRTEAAEAAEAFANQEENESDRWLCFMAFDLIYVKSHLVPSDRQQSLTGLTYKERRDLLHKVIRPTPHKVEIIASVIVDRIDKKERYNEMFDALDEVMEDRGEGLMLKSISSTYDLDQRRRESWVKVKPEYFAALNDELDVIVLGGYLADGQRRTGGASHWMLGLAKDPTDGGLPTQFYSFGKVGTGYSLQELHQLRSQLKAGEHRWEGTPEHLMGWKPAKASDRPDFWYEPSKSVILTVIGAEIVPSPHWSSGYVIRFPRVKRIRWPSDKPWHACLRFTELREVHARNRGGLSLSRMESGQRAASGREGARKKPTKRARTAVGMVPAQFTAVARAIREKANSESKLFAGHNVLIIPFDVSPPLQFRHVNGEIKIVQTNTDLAVLLENNGATYIATAPRNKRIDYVLVHSEVSPQRLQNIIETDKVDLLFVDWALANLARGELVVPKFRDYYHMCSATRETYGNIDRFGDHQTEPTSAQALKALLSRVQLETDREHASQRRRRGGARSLSCPSPTFSVPSPSLLSSAPSPTAHRGNRAENVAFAVRTLLEDEDDPLLTHSTPLRACVLYFDRFTLLRTSSGDEEVDRPDFLVSRMAVLVSLARMHGADVRYEFTQEVTHVIMDPASPLAAKHLQEVDAVLAFRRRISIGKDRSAHEPLITQDFSAKPFRADFS